MDSSNNINERLAYLEEEIKLLKSKDNIESLIKLEKKEKIKKEKKPREPTEYNKFISEYLTKEKQKLGELYNHKVSFLDATKEWQKQKN